MINSIVSCIFKTTNKQQQQCRIEWKLKLRFEIVISLFVSENSSWLFVFYLNNNYNDILNYYRFSIKRYFAYIYLQIFWMIILKTYRIFVNC